MESMCSYAGAKASAVRRRAHEIVEMMRWEYSARFIVEGPADGAFPLLARA